MSDQHSLTSDQLVPNQHPCPKCSRSMLWVDCWNCAGDGYSDHDCGEDTCCCLFPEDNVECDTCDANGGWYACWECNPGCFDD